MTLLGLEKSGMKFEKDDLTLLEWSWLGELKTVIEERQLEQIKRG